MRLDVMYTVYVGLTSKLEQKIRTISKLCVQKLS